MRDGAWADGVVGVLPTVTYPSHTTLITGVHPAVHGIHHNRIVDPEELSNAAWFWYAKDIKVPTLVSAPRSPFARAAINWPATVGLEPTRSCPSIGHRGIARGWRCCAPCQPRT